MIMQQLSATENQISPLILPMGGEFSAYLRDESRISGQAESISFPRGEDQICAILQAMSAAGMRVTAQGGRTGLAAGCVPAGGHILNLSRMQGLLRLRGEQGRFYLSVQPGLSLLALNKLLAEKRLASPYFDAESQRAAQALAQAPAQFFAPDPTETGATLGGMAACNASGARSFRYGSMRRHVRALRVALIDGDMLALKRGQCRAQGRRLTLCTESGRKIELELPAYTMPQAKNASGYYIEDNLDAVDLFIGSDGSLGVISELELCLLPLPPVIWGITALLKSERQALDLIPAIRALGGDIAAIEYFDAGALHLLRRQRARGSAFAHLPEIPPAASAAVYTELHCADEDAAYALLASFSRVLAAAGGNADATWTARSAPERERLRLFRHAAPEAVNLLIDERRRIYPGLAKLGTDMSVPQGKLPQVMRLYREGLRRENLQAAVWGHIGDNHLHVNILPRHMQDYRRGQQLYCEWAAAITAWGGAVSAEHGIGKLKTGFLAIMYGEQQVRAMAELKTALDPHHLLGTGNLFAGGRAAAGQGPFKKK